MDTLDFCDDLITPVTDKFVLSAVKCSKNNKNSVIFVFDHPDDYDKGNKSYESVIWTYTKGAVLPACQFALADKGEFGELEFTGETANKTVNLGGIQFVSLIQALAGEGADEDALKDGIKRIMKSSAEDIVNEMQQYIGLLVGTPMSGRVKGRDNMTRVQFRFKDWEYSQDPRDNTTLLNEIRDNAFTYVSEDEQLDQDREGSRYRRTRPNTGVTPEGQEDGDEILE